MRSRIISVVGAAFLTSGVALAGTTVPGSETPAEVVPFVPTSEVATPATAEANVLGRLHADNLAEIAHGQMAIDKGFAPAVKAYGRQLVADHKAADQKVMALAKRLKVSQESMANEATVEMEKGRSDPRMSSLHNATGAEFDRQFVAAMADEHERTIEFLAGARAGATNAEVRALIDKLLPTIEKHRAEAQRLSQTLGKPST